MTAQVSDTVDVDGVRHSIAGISGTGLFDPAAHGVASPPMSTGCWRGYVCRYAVVGDAFLLHELLVSAAATVGDVPVAAGATLLGAAAEPARAGETVFRYDALVVPFTGTLLAGHGFVRDTYVHMGFQPAWRWEHVVELAVEAGRVTARRDKSAEMAAIRERVAANATDPDGERSDPRGWIARTFGLGYDRTYGDPPRPPER